MKFKLFISIVIMSILLEGQNVPLENIFDRSLSPKGISLITPMKNPEFYSVLNRGKDAYEVNKYSYKTSKKVETIFSTKDFTEMEKFFSYKFNDDESKLVIASNYKQIYRRSFLANYFVIDLKTKKLIKVDNEPVQQATLSPDGKYIAYMKNNNLFIQNLTNNKVSQITKDGEKNKIINGISDWVYEEEFGIVKMFEWSKNSKNIMYVKFDETEVKEISMDIFPKDKLYPIQLKFKYPKAGEKNSKVSLWLYDIKDKNNINVNLSEWEYIPRIFPYMKDGFGFMVMNREQNKVNISGFEKKDINSKGKVNYEEIYSEESKTYVEVPTIKFIKDRECIISSEKDGYNHLYYYNYGKQVNQITKGKWDVINLYGYNPKNKTVFFQSYMSGAKNKVVTSIDIKGKNLTYLSKKEGNSNAYFNSDFSLFIERYSNDETPNIYSLKETKNNKTINVIEDNKKLIEKFKKFKLPKKEFFNIDLDEVSLNAYMLKPNNFDKSKKYPLFIHLYGGPGSQKVSDNWSNGNDLWLKHLANKGYIVVVLDPRGTGARGEEFKKITYKKLGHFETVDLINSAKKLSEEKFIDGKRIGVFGWSYGGYMTSLAMTKGADIFTLGVAVAPVINWRYYDSIYTERFLSTPQKNKKGYEDNSPINFADRLKGKYLLIHGSADDNVHHQNAMIMAQKLIELNKPFDYFIYPNKDHGIGGGKTRIHLLTKITKYIEENL